jgi:uncharacterized protein (TIGR02145 family)
MKPKIWIYSLVILGGLFTLTNSCSKDETPSSSKKDPIITWAHPADISFGTILSATQLNATADVPGTFIYTPPIGTKLNKGLNQDLKADFTPTDATTYNSISKTIKINVADSVTATDVEGNVYHTITIGTQVWMVENLKTTKYNDGTAIPLVTVDTAWSNLSTSGYCWCDNDSTYKNNYGAYYNWYAVNTGKLAPKGWHVPADAEWKLLEGAVDGQYGIGNPEWDIVNDFRGVNAGTNLKSISGWYGGGNGTDPYGFSCLPSGFRFSDGTFSFTGYESVLWTSTECSNDSAWYRYLDNTHPEVYRFYFNKKYGFSVRCLKDY